MARTIIDPSRLAARTDGRIKAVARQCGTIEGLLREPLPTQRKAVGAPLSG